MTEVAFRQSVRGPKARFSTFIYTYISSVFYLMHTYKMGVETDVRPSPSTDMGSVKIRSVGGNYQGKSSFVLSAFEFTVG